jgi:hypothetical protein
MTGGLCSGYYCPRSVVYANYIQDASDQPVHPDCHHSRAGRMGDSAKPGQGTRDDGDHEDSYRGYSNMIPHLSISALSRSAAWTRDQLTDRVSACAYTDAGAIIMDRIAEEEHRYLELR